MPLSSSPKIKKLKESNGTISRDAFELENFSKFLHISTHEVHDFLTQV